MDEDFASSRMLSRCRLRCRKLLSSCLSITSVDECVLKHIQDLENKLKPSRSLKKDVITLRRGLMHLMTIIVLGDDDTLHEYSQTVMETRKCIKMAKRVQRDFDNLKIQVDSLKFVYMVTLSKYNNIQIKGVPQNDNEQLFKLLFLIGDIIDQPIAKSQVKFIIRHPTQESTECKPILVCFDSQTFKHEFLGAAQCFTDANPITLGQLGFTGTDPISISNFNCTDPDYDHYLPI